MLEQHLKLLQKRGNSTFLKCFPHIKAVKVLLSGRDRSQRERHVWSVIFVTW